MRKSIWLLSAGLFAITTPAFAQQTDTDKGGAQPTDGATAEAAAVEDNATQDQTAAQANAADVGDIVVTATRRNEALSDVPLAVSAITAQTLENSGVADIRQLTQVSPSLLVSSTQSEAGAGVARIRGVGTVGDNPGLESSVAVFIDGVYRSRTGVGLTELGQVDRIEVLRGPQGTLFGRNASAGLISIITARPSFTPSINGELTIGNYDMRRVEVGATGGLNDAFAVRADAVYVKRDGFLTDVLSGRDLNDRNRYLVRLQGLYKPNDDFSFRLIGDYSDRDEECCAAAYLRARDYTRPSTSVVEQPSTTLALVNALNGNQTSDDTFSRRVAITPGRDYAQDVKDYGVSGEAVYDFGGAELTSITAYRYNKYIRGQDVDYNALDLAYRASDGGSFNQFKTFTQELRLQGSAMNDRIDWLVGGYFARENLTVRDNLTYGADYERYLNCQLAGSVLQQPNTASLVAGSGANANCSGQFSAPLAALGGAAAAQALFTQIAAIPAAQRNAQQAQLFAFIPALLLFNSDTTVPGFRGVQAALGIPAAQRGFTGVGINDLYEQRSNNLALFTHNIFSLTDALKLTIGARYTRERKTFDATLRDNNSFCAALTQLSALPPSASPPFTLQQFQQLPCVLPSVPGGLLVVPRDKRTEKKLTGTVVLSYKPSDSTLTYLSYSRGYKAGGFNLDRSVLARSNFGASATSVGVPGGVLPNATAAPLQFRPEINDAVEAGLKFNGRGIDINVAVFNQLFRDFQLNTFNGINFFVENINGCKNDLNGADFDNIVGNGACPATDLRAGVRSRGIELEAFLRPATDVTVNLGTTLVSTRYREDLVGAGGRPLLPALFQLPGARLSNSQEGAFTASLGFNPRVTSSGIRALFYLDGRHSTSFNTGSDLDIEKVQNAFTVVNGRIGLQGPGGRWGVELWAQNLLNEDFIQVGFDALIQGSSTQRAVQSGFATRSNQLFGAFLGEPRTYGLTLRTRL